MVGKLAPAVVVGRAREKREQDLVGREADPDGKAEIAVVRGENVFAARERHRRAGLQRFVPFTAERERNFALTIELEAAVVELPLQQHVAEDLPQLLVGQAAAVERGRFVPSRFRFFAISSILFYRQGW